jgi:Uma2 family endonuclease
MAGVQAPAMRTMADVLKRLGGVPLDRIRFHPPPGTASIQDVIDIEAREGKLCELIEGVLVEKIMGFTEGQLALWIGTLLNQFVQPRNLGIVTGADSTVELIPDLVRIPDVAFTSWDRIPGRRRPMQPVPRLVPDLAVEVLSTSNTPGEMAAKRTDYFNAGVSMVWEVDPDARTVTVYLSLTLTHTLTVTDTLDGQPVLSGFRLPLADLFGELDRQG